MKKILAVILSVILSLAGISVFAEDGDLTITLQIGNPVMTVNNEGKPIDENGTAPVIINDRTLLPVRAVVEEMGGAVTWDADTRTVSLTYGDDEIRLIIDNTTAYHNDKPSTLEAAPTIINDRTMLPIRFIAESFKFDVAWDGETQIVTITKAAEAIEPTATPAATVEPTAAPAATAEPTAAPADNEQQESKTLVAYFSATNNTEGVAKHIAEGIGADIYEITPEEPYTDADLDYNSDCRANREQNDDSARPAISGTVENMEQYDTIFLGYPIWWGNAPKIIFTFLESYDFSGKTIIPFCTSGSSPIGSTTAMQNVTQSANWLDGHRFGGGASSDTVMDWVNGLDLK